MKTVMFNLAKTLRVLIPDEGELVLERHDCSRVGWVTVLNFSQEAFKDSLVEIIAYLDSKD